MVVEKRRRRQRNSGSIRVIVAGKYRIGYDLPRRSASEPRRQRFAIVNGTKKDAETKLRSILEELSKGDAIKDDAMTFGGLCDRFLAARAMSIEETTLALYRRNFKQHLRPAIGNIRVRDLRATDIESLVQGLRNTSRTKQRGEPLHPTSARNILIAVRTVLRWGVKRKFATRNVADDVDAPKPQHTERRIIGRDDVEAIVASAKGSELENIVPFALLTGLRRSEICGLKWSDFDLKMGTVRIQRAAANVGGKVVLKNTKTRKSARTVYLPSPIVALMAQHRMQQAQRHLALGIGNLVEGRFAFDRLDGRSWDPNELSRAFSRLVTRKKMIRIRFHDLRHANATLKHAAGIQLQDISESLGHSSLATTSSIYVHLLGESKRENTNRLEDYLGSTLQGLPHASSRR